MQISKSVSDESHNNKLTADNKEPELKAIYNGTVLCMNESFSEYREGLIIYAGPKIIYVGNFSQELIAAVPYKNRINAHKGIVLPGFINTHTHIGMSFFRTLADDTADRLKKILFPMEKMFVEPDLVYWASLHALAEMILGGTTTFADMYYFEMMTAKAALESGIRGIVAESLTTASSPDSPGFSESFELSKELVHALRGNKLITPGLAPHAPYSLEEKELVTIGDFTQSNKISLLSHLAEMPFEEACILEKYGLRPVQFYKNCGLLHKNATFAHCIFTSEQDRRDIISADSGIAHNVCANAKSGKGIAPAAEFFSEQARIGLGTDGPMSGNTLDIISQLRPASLFQKVRFLNPTIMKPKAIIEMATMGGAKALHLERSIGSLEPEKLADIIIISTESPHMFPIYDPYAAIVYCAGAQDVSTVIVHGEILMRNRKLETLDQTAIREAGVTFTHKISKEIHKII